MYAGQMEGLIAFGMNPVANGPNTPKMLAALSKLKWLIVADCFETETSSFWKAKDLAEKYYATAPDAAAIQTEVFLLPAACFAEKDGAFVNSSRWAQWKNVALDPPGDALRDQEIIARLFLKLRELYAKEGGAAPEPLHEHVVELAEPAVAFAFAKSRRRSMAATLRASSFRRLAPLPMTAAPLAATGSMPDRLPKPET